MGVIYYFIQFSICKPWNTFGSSLGRGREVIIVAMWKVNVHDDISENIHTSLIYIQLHRKFKGGIQQPAVQSFSNLVLLPPSIDTLTWEWMIWEPRANLTEVSFVSLSMPGGMYCTAQSATASELITTFGQHLCRVLHALQLVRDKIDVCVHYWGNTAGRGLGCF